MHHPVAFPPIIRFLVVAHSSPLTSNIFQTRHTGSSTNPYCFNNQGCGSDDKGPLCWDQLVEKKIIAVML